ncbi:MAG: VOC family protein [Kofleriaceae bacterium]
MPTHHHFDHIELVATDMAAAKAFYGAAFGWKFKDWGDDYADILEAGVAGGILHTEKPPIRGEVLAIIYSKDLEATEQAIKAAGGTVGTHHEFPGGRRFQFQDPSGNELAVWTKTS